MNDCQNGLSKVFQCCIALLTLLLHVTASGAKTPVVFHTCIEDWGECFGHLQPGIESLTVLQKANIIPVSFYRRKKERTSRGAEGRDTHIYTCIYPHTSHRERRQTDRLREKEKERGQRDRDTERKADWERERGTEKKDIFSSLYRHTCHEYLFYLLTEITHFLINVPCLNTS